MSGRNKSVLRVTHVSRVKADRFGTLVTRSLEDGRGLGKVSVLHEHLPPHTRLPEIHHRRTAEFVYCLSGEMSAYLDGRRHRIRAGGVILIPRGVRHRFVTGARACEALSVFRPALAIGPGADIHAEP